LAKFKLFWFFCLGFAFRQKTNVLECALALLACCLTAYSRYVLAGILHNCGGLALQFGALKKIAPSKTLLRFPSYNGIRFAFCNMFS
jgi:hypothetical protein